LSDKSFGILEELITIGGILLNVLIPNGLPKLLITVEVFSKLIQSSSPSFLYINEIEGI